MFNRYRRRRGSGLISETFTRQKYISNWIIQINGILEFNMSEELKHFSMNNMQFKIRNKCNCLLTDILRYNDRAELV